MTEINLEVLTPILAVIATVVSIISLFNSKRAIYSNIIATKRFDWMEALRDKYTAFISVYCDSVLPAEEKVCLLAQKKFEIELYFDNREREYREISRELAWCIARIKTGREAVIPKSLIRAIQKTFSNTHKRAKREAGITVAMEDKMRKDILG